MSVLTDKTGDKSSKRLIAMSSGFTGIALIIFVVILGCFIVIPNATLITTLIVTDLTTCLIALGFSIPEWFSKLRSK